MFWLPESKDETATPRLCTLTWVRYANGESQDVERMEHVLWRVRGNAHYLTYEETSDTEVGEASSDHVRTTLRLEETALTWIRHGMVEWTHVFRGGEIHASRMRLGAQVAPVETETSALDIDIRPDGGQVHLVYNMKLGGHDDKSERIEVRIEIDVSDG